MSTDAPAPAATPSSLGYLRPYRGQLAWGVAMLLLTNAFYLGVPEMLGRAVDAIGKQTDREIAMIVLWMAVFAVLTAITRIWSRIWIFNAARAAEYDLRSDLFGHLMTLSPSYYRKTPVGDVMSRLTNDVQTVRAVWGFGLVSLANALLAFVSVLGVMLWTDPIVTLWVILPFPLIYVVGQAMSKRIFGTMRAVQAELGTLSSRIQEDLGAIQVIKTYGLEGVRRRGFVEGSDRLLRANMDAAKVRIQLGPMLNALAALGMALLIFFGGRAYVHDDMTKGEIVAFSGYLARLVWPTLTLGFLLALVQRGRASWMRLVQLQQTKPDIPDGAGPPLPASDLPARVEVKDLTLRYDDRAVLEHIDLTLEPGTVTAIVGRTGSGKSTLVDALCRLIEVPPGTILIDGHDVSTLPLASLRAQIGYAPQEAFLFSTTISDNIAMGYGAGTAIPAARARELERVIGMAASADLRDEPKVTAAAAAAGLVRDLVVMPEGLGTIVGERGITLSGGQRQRVALARALAASPRLLVLDDSLSSVDAETERLILKHLRAVMHGRTAVLISHRVAAIKDADQIVVLDAGRIVARGTHHQLLAAGGLYSELYRTQLDPETTQPTTPVTFDAAEGTK
ncbi:MAG: ABC transporter ATP-binding protein [Deltaproteobacteria bacterium]|nr:ABC transporter ATP-binding protein [Deltaproteobacteria bacterium]MDQ3299357.1 ABC transporter ATP-binding protein/permease [Myxococcota bacterium]